MSFDIADIRWIDTCQLKCLADDTGLTGNRWRRHTSPVRTVIVGRHRTNHGMYLIAVGQRITEPLQSDHRRTGTENCSTGQCIKRATMTISAKRHPWFKIVGNRLRNRDGSRAHQCGIALAQ
ncbi:hypothetical protein D3C78_1146430 [compost metagenome]